MELPVTLQNQIVDFLKSLPNLDDTKSRRAFIYSAGFDSKLKAQIPFDEPPAQFVPLLLSILIKYGTTNKRHPIEALLEASKDYIGQDKQIECEHLIKKLHVSLLDKASNSDGIINEIGKIKRLKKFIYQKRKTTYVLIGFVLFVGIGAWFFVYPLTKIYHKYSNVFELSKATTSVVSLALIKKTLEESQTGYDLLKKIEIQTEIFVYEIKQNLHNELALLASSIDLKESEENSDIFYSKLDGLKKLLQFRREECIVIQNKFTEKTNFYKLNIEKITLTAHGTDFSPEMLKFVLENKEELIFFLING